MGYRSDVAAMFYADKGKDWPVLKLWLQENFPCKMFESEITWHDLCMVVECKNVKWYSDYDEVKAFNAATLNFIDMFCEGEEDLPQGCYEFVRIGEELDDVETEYHGDECGYYLDVSRNIEIALRHPEKTNG